MAINRFSRGPIAADVRSSFMPLPVDLIGRQMERRQSAFDKAKASVDETQEAVYSVKGLAADRETLKKISSKYTDEAQKEIDKVGGDYSRLNAYSDRLAANLVREMRTGQLGQIQNNWAKAQNHMKELTDLRREGKISEAGYNRGLSSISGFGGTVDDGKGGYTQASFYTPTKYLELGKTADEYGAKIKDQYDKEGRRFIRGKVATQHILNNLWNNPQALDNAKEQLWSQLNAKGIDFDSLDNRKQNALIDSYLGTVAKAAGNKLQFQQYFKPDDSDSDSADGGAIFNYQMTSKVPKKLIYGMNDVKFADQIADAKDAGSVGFWRSLGIYANNLAKTALSYRGEQLGGEEFKYREGVEKDMAKAEIEANKALQKQVAEMTKSDLMVDLARQNGIDLKSGDVSVEDIAKLANVMEQQATSSVNNQITLARNKKTEENFKYGLVESGQIVYRDIINVNTGERLSHKEKMELLNSHMQENEDGTGQLRFSGEIVPGKAAQPYGIGTMMMSTIDGDGELATFAIESEQTHSPAYVNDRKKYALQNGFVSYRDGSDQVSFRRDNEGNLIEYLNGKAVLKHTLQ